MLTSSFTFKKLASSYKLFFTNNATTSTVCALRSLSVSMIRNNTESNDADAVSDTAGPLNKHVPPIAPKPPKRVRIGDLERWKRKNRKIVMMTAYSYPSAVHAQLANVDIILVGDSVGMVEMGYSTTQKVTMEEIIHHSRAVARGSQSPLVVADMPFGSYEISVDSAMNNAFRLIKEGNADAVKLEGGKRNFKAISKIVESGIAVMGHTGLTPASVSSLGGFKIAGKTSDDAMRIFEDALAIQDAGAFACVLECLPAKVARFISERLTIPTIGIGAGVHTDGQVLVYHDLCGMLQHPHHAMVTPKFCKQFGNVGLEIQRSIEDYRDEVRSGTFPNEQYSPYAIPDKEWEKFQNNFSSEKKPNSINQTTASKYDTDNEKIY